MVVQIQYMRQTTRIAKQQGGINGGHKKSDPGPGQSANDDKDKTKQCLYSGPEGAHMAFLQRQRERAADIEWNVEGERHAGHQKRTARQRHACQMHHQSAQQQGRRQQGANFEGRGDIAAIPGGLPGGKATWDKGNERSAHAKRE